MVETGDKDWLYNIRSRKYFQFCYLNQEMFLVLSKVLGLWFLSETRTSEGSFSSQCFFFFSGLLNVQPCLAAVPKDRTETERKDIDSSWLDQQGRALPSQQTLHFPGLNHVSAVSPVESL